jgi:hypothetical protein
MNNKPQCHTNERNHMHQTAKLNLITEPIKCDAYGCQGQCMQESIRNKQKQPRKLYYIAKFRGTANIRNRYGDISI